MSAICDRCRETAGDCICGRRVPSGVMVAGAALSCLALVALLLLGLLVLLVVAGCDLGSVPVAPAETVSVPVPGVPQ